MSALFALAVTLALAPVGQGRPKPSPSPVVTPAPVAPAPAPAVNVPPPAPDVPKITLEQALMLALSANPQIQLANNEIASRAAAILVARAPFDSALEAALDVGLSRRPSPERPDGELQDTSVGGRLGYVHRLPWGTTVGVSLAHRYQDSANLLTILAPQFTTDLRATLSQPVLRGFGSDINLALVGVAETLEKASRLDAERTAHEVLANVAIAYWIVAQAEEEVAIRRRAFERAQRVGELTGELIKRGSLPQAAEVQARSSVALRLARLQAAERIRQDAQSALSRAILDRVPARVTAAETMPVPAPAPTATPAAATERSDVRAAELRAQALSSSTLVAEDRTRPSLDLSLFAGLSGLGGTTNQLACEVFTPRDADGNIIPGSQPSGCIAGGDFDGYGKSWSTLFGGGFYTAGLAATLLLPLSDEGAQGAAQQARLAVDQAKLAAEQLRRAAENDVASLRALMVSDRRAFETAEQARAVTQQLIDIEEQRYKVGSATTFDVLRVQDDLAEAESLASSARAAVLASDIRYHLAAGLVLQHLGVKLP